MVKDGAAVLEETAFSFTGAVALSAFCCCSTMSFVALCIKFITWMWGNRQRRPRVVIQNCYTHNGHNSEQRMYEVVGVNATRNIDHDTELRKGVGAVAISEVELREMPQTLEKQRSCNWDTDIVV